MIKLIASDIDGTLLREGTHELNPRLYDVILKLHEKGIHFVAASGRQWPSIERIFDPIKHKIFYLSNNGAYIGCFGRQLDIRMIGRELAFSLVRDIRKIPGMEALISGPDVLYMESKDEALVDWMVNGYQYRVELVEDLTKIDDEIIMVTAHKDTGIQDAVLGLIEKYGDRLKMSISGNVWMDCMISGVSKGQAIAVLQENLNILPEETMVFGDQLNDLEMMERAYYSFTVGNARPEVKAAVRFQTDTNEHDGVLKILEYLL